jgi:hypothetical protein
MNQAAIRPIAPGQRPARSPAGAAAAAGFIGLAGFELALALGAPLGRAAMGGTHTYLPAGLRIVAGFATLFWPPCGAGGAPPRRVSGAADLIEGVRDAPCVRTLTGTRP